MRAPLRFAAATMSEAVTSRAGATASGSRRACDVIQFWQFETAKKPAR